MPPPLGVGTAAAVGEEKDILGAITNLTSSIDTCIAEYNHLECTHLKQLFRPK